MGNGPLPIVSIGMPVYNGERFLKAALDSLLTQTFKDFELIISDNASTDDTEKICKEYAAKDIRVRYICQAENKGATWNFNFVLQEARGQYFMWAASDDMWDARYVETLVACLESDPTYVGAFGDYVFIGEEPCEEAVRVPEDAAPCWPITTRFPELLGDEVRIRRVFALARYRDDRFIYGLYRSAVMKKLEIKPWRLARQYTQDGAYPQLFFLVAAGKIRIEKGVRFYYRVRGKEAATIPLLVHACIKMEMITSSILGLWRGSRSLLTTVVGSVVIAFYQLRSLMWYMVPLPVSVKTMALRAILRQ